MKFSICGLVLATVLLLVVQAEPVPEPVPEPAKGGQRASFRAAQPIELDDAEKEDGDVAPAKGDASSGRLFMKKFLLFKNMFGQNQQQPVIPIIIAGGSGGTGGSYITPTYGTSPTTTITSTGTIPTASGTIITTPTGQGLRSSYDDNKEPAYEEEAAVDEQEMQAALAAGAQEYVVTDAEIKGTSDGKATRQPNRINLRRKGAKRGQVVSVRIPPKYRGYFKSGQKVMLNTNSRPGKRRVVRKGGNRKRKVNKNRRRVVG